MNKLIKSKSLFGIPLYKKYRQDNKECRVYFGGIYREEVFFDKIFGKSFKQAHLMGVPLWGKRFTQLDTVWFIGERFVVFRKLLAKELSSQLNKIFKDVEVRLVCGKKNVIIFAGNSGEIALVIKFFFKDFIFSLGCKDLSDIVVLCTKQYHKEMLNLYFPNVRTEVANLSIIEKLPRTFNAGDWRVTMCFPRNFYVGKDWWENERGLVARISSWFGLKISSPQEPDRELLKTAYKKARRKISSLHLSALDGNSGKGLVILAFEANTLDPLPEKFQIDLRGILTAQGYVLLESTSDINSPLYLSYSELYAVAEHAVGVYALRSGLVDFLSDVLVPIHVYYTTQKSRGNGFLFKTSKDSWGCYTLKDIMKFNPYLKEFYFDDSGCPVFCNVD